MTSGEMHVDFGTLEAGRAGIDATFKQLTTTLDDLERGLQPMVNEWSGSAREAYMQAKKQWDDAANALALVLQNVGSSVGQANDNYRQAESHAQSAWS